MTTLNTDSYLTTSQAAEKLGITVDAVKQYCYHKKMAAIKVGRQWMIHKKEVDRYSKENSGKVGRPPSE